MVSFRMAALCCGYTEGIVPRSACLKWQFELHQSTTCTCNLSIIDKVIVTGVDKVKIENACWDTGWGRGLIFISSLWNLIRCTMYRHINNNYATPSSAFSNAPHSSVFREMQPGFNGDQVGRYSSIRSDHEPRSTQRIGAAETVSLPRVTTLGGLPP